MPTQDPSLSLPAPTASAYPAELPARFTTVADEHQALVAGRGVTLGACPDRVELAGADRERFLNGLVTCDIRNLPPGEGRCGFFTDIKGRILADVILLAMEDRFLLELPAGSGERIVEHLEKYVIVDRVEIGRLAPVGRVRFLGPASGERLGELLESEPPAGAWAHSRVRWEGHEALVCAVSAEASGGAPEWVVTLEAEAASDLFARWATVEATPAGELADLRPVGRAALESRRVECGRLLFGIDYGTDHFPQESGREEAVSYEKGCYLGQEIVARIHYRGGVNRLPRGLLFDGDQPAAGALLSLDRREVGRATTVAHSVALDRSAGLALVHRRAAEAGTRLEIEGGGEAEVAELPLLRPGSQGQAG